MAKKYVNLIFTAFALEERAQSTFCDRLEFENASKASCCSAYDEV